MHLCVHSVPHGFEHNLMCFKSIRRKHYPHSDTLHMSLNMTLKKHVLEVIHDKVYACSGGERQASQFGKTHIYTHIYISNIYIYIHVYTLIRIHILIKSISNYT